MERIKYSICPWRNHNNHLYSHSSVDTMFYFYTFYRDMVMSDLDLTNIQKGIFLIVYDLVCKKSLKIPKGQFLKLSANHYSIYGNDVFIYILSVNPFLWTAKIVFELDKEKTIFVIQRMCDIFKYNIYDEKHVSKT